MARGQLRIYLGAAPGVGKTFAMLAEGRRRAERGTDVVVGYVETHGRAHTHEQLRGLEVVILPVSCSHVVDVEAANGVIAESHGKRLTAFNIAPDGSLSNRRAWADLHDGVPDGICIDAENAVWYADVPNKRCVRVREGGEVLQTVNADRGCFACMLGGLDKSTLFVVATEWRGMEKVAEVAQARTGQVLTVEAPAPGVGWP